MGTIARGLPFWEVVRLNRFAPRLRLDRYTLVAENLFDAG